MSAEIVSNRRAFHNYQILERIEAGIELQGTEVKSIRAGLANLNHAFARVDNGEVFLYDADIQPYERASHSQHEPKRPRKLLLHKSEIGKLFSASSVEGQTLVALRLYWKSRPSTSGTTSKRRLSKEKPIAQCLPSTVGTGNKTYRFHFLFLEPNTPTHTYPDPIFLFARKLGQNLVYSLFC
jgi:SsrA-binding protein